MEIEIRQGSITEQPDIEVIVNAANTELWMGSGVAGFIKRDGGDEIEKEAISKGPLNLGEALFTRSGNLANKYVVHAAAMGYRATDIVVPKRSGTMSSDKIIRDCTINSLSIAGELGCCSIAFPALATGVGKFPVYVCAQVMISAVKDYYAQNPQTTIKKAAFILFGETDKRIFDDTLKSIQADFQ